MVENNHHGGKWLLYLAICALAVAVTIGNIGLYLDRASDRTRIKNLNLQTSCLSESSAHLDVLTAQELGLIARTVSALSGGDREGAQVAVRQLGELAPKIGEAAQARADSIVNCGERKS